MTSSHDSMPLEAEKFATALIYEEIQSVWKETAIPARQVMSSPEKTLPRSLANEGYFSVSGVTNERPNGRINKKPKRVGMR